MQKLVLIFCCVTIMALSCRNRANEAVPIGVPGGVAKEAVNTNSYTYVRLDVAGKDQWVAIPRAEIKIGTTYYYQGGMVMENFKSKELNRTFDNVLFLEGISEDKNLVAGKQAPAMGSPKEPEAHYNVNAKATKQAINIAPAKGGITISELFAQKEKYAGKTVKISGLVVKFSPEIMNKNWIHLQDGTEANGKFDLTVTTKAKAEVGDTVAIEGKITINKDFGYGYSYEVLMEDATISK